MKSLLSIALIGAMIIMLGCNASKSLKGGAIGAAAGGAVGAVVGAHSDNTALGAIIGAAVGGTAGVLIGKKMDKQAEELEKDLEGAEITRVGEGIRVTFDSGLMFAVNESSLNQSTRANLTELSQTLQKYPNTEILIEGHTDSDGSEEYNQTLSVKRATSVANFLTQQGVQATRLTTTGYGELQPISDNTTKEGKQKNRRVEVAIYANEEMKKAAKDGTLKVE